ncbi:heteromeric transposase endonuclease subunit TnsA [Maridesulfovibrio zosterae]|uniref:heteromeric transposase endonuclease subunit TnsA n=1 Tax=Maridesulfovibrio zosterae TaxID=82171 RepID=UPI0004293005|nr:heteromeric transposase endonuclease subunit TnsA [Maridesulfovibrio zosterae]
MSKRNSGLTEGKIKRWIKEGRGAGRGPAYSPWLRVRDIPSKGRSHRVFGHKSRRTHHLFSDLELAVFLTLDWCSKTIEIREQFPLQQGVTLELAKEASIRHPQISGILQVMSSDFLVNSSDPNLPKFALQVKYTKDLSDPRTVEKLELERRYWAYKDVPWFLVTEKDISSTAFQNIEWLYPDQQRTYELSELTEQLKFYSHHFTKNPSTTIIKISKSLDVKYDHEAGESLAEIRALLASRLLSFDVNIPFRKLTPVNIGYVEDISALEVINV